MGKKSNSGNSGKPTSPAPKQAPEAGSEVNTDNTPAAAAAAEPKISVHRPQQKQRQADGQGNAASSATDPDPAATRPNIPVQLSPELKAQAEEEQRKKPKIEIVTPEQPADDDEKSRTISSPAIYDEALSRQPQWATRLDQVGAQLRDTLGDALEKLRDFKDQSLEQWVLWLTEDAMALVTIKAEITLLNMSGVAASGQSGNAARLVELQRQAQENLTARRQALSRFAEFHTNVGTRRALSIVIDTAVRMAYAAVMVSADGQ